MVFLSGLCAVSPVFYNVPTCQISTFFKSLAQIGLEFLGHAWATLVALTLIYLAEKLIKRAVLLSPSSFPIFLDISSDL